ncbi:MAG: ATP-binding protein [Desulfobacteraceae bacterium]
MRSWNMESLVHSRRPAIGDRIEQTVGWAGIFEKSAGAPRHVLFKQRIFKLLGALLLGLVGFGVNFQAIRFNFPPFEGRLMPGLVFPMLVALAWGWRYGLVSATLGLGCQTLWFVWLKSGGVEYVVSIPMLTLWVVWHGWCATRSRRGRFPFHNIYLAEIPFRLCNTIVLYTILYAVLQWQPPTWMLAGQPGEYYLDLIHFRAIEQMVNGYIVLLIADVLLSLGPVRLLFGLKMQRGQVGTYYVIIAALLFGLMFWVIDGLVDYYKFREHLRFLIFQAPENALDSILINVSSPDLFARTAFVMSCLAGGILVSRLLRRQLESAAALEASEARYRRLHQTMRDAFVQMDMTGRIVDANDAFQQMLGHEKKALLSMKEADLTPPRWRASIAKIVSEQVLPLGRSEVFEKEYLRADGSRFPAELRTFLITDDSGNPIGMWSIVRDVTQRKQAEMEREAAIKALKRSNEDLKQFAYVASHDLQEPLRMVASYTQLLAERYEDQLDQKAHKFIHYAVDGAQRMQILIRDLLAFSRVETRAQAFKPLDSHHVLCGAMANLKTLINETGALVTSGDLPIVQADESQLTQLFQNLISNGIKFRQPSTTPSIHISAQRVENRWRLAVQDNGIGIDSKYKERVFVIFQRLHTRDEYPGTGIGLAICKRIVHRHGGRIWFESSPGKGTTFYFTLPSI